MEIFSLRADGGAMRAPKLETLLSPEMSQDRVGKRVTALRETLRLQKSQFADSIGLDRSALSRIEQGKEGLGLAKAALIADQYRFGLNYIYRGDLNDVPVELRPVLLVELHTVGALPKK